MKTYMKTFKTIILGPDLPTMFSSTDDFPADWLPKIYILSDNIYMELCFGFDKNTHLLQRFEAN